MAATLSWTIPSGISNNTFSVTLVSDQALQNVSLDDFVLRQVGGAFFEATAVATLHQVQGTNNWRLDVTLTGTYDADFWVRLRPGRLTDEDGATNALLTSSNFHVDSSYIPLSIEAIDEQNIPILTEDYELEIDITGNPTRAYVDGDMEGFYHVWDPTNSKIRIKAIKVTRLISGAIWNVRLVKGTQTLNSQITYNVVPSAPVISDPGAQKLYRGGLFGLDVAIANRPTLARGNSLLTGLKYQARADGVDGVNLAGQLPAAANLTESAFNANIYTENDGGHDNLAVPITIETHTGVYVFDSITDDLLKIGPDAATRHWIYEAPSPGLHNNYDPLVASPDGVYLFSDAHDDLLKVSPDGNLLWTFADATSGHYNEMVVTESGVYVHRSGAIYKVHPVTGLLIWESSITYSAANFHVFAGDVYVLSGTTLTKLSGEDGTVAWTYQAPSGYWLRAVAGDGAYLQNRGQIRKINIETGMLAWTSTVSGSSFYLPVADSSGFYIFSTTNSRLFKLNASDGMLAWTFNASFDGSPILDSDGIYLDDPTTVQRLAKVNLSDGSEAWSISGLPVPIIYPNGIYDNSGFSNILRKFNKSTGSMDWSVTVNKIRSSRLFVEDGSDLYAVAPFGSGEDVVKLNVSDGSEQWRYASTTGDYRSLAIPDFSLGV